MEALVAENYFDNSFLKYNLYRFLSVDIDCTLLDSKSTFSSISSISSKILDFNLLLVFSKSISFQMKRNGHNCKSMNRL